MIVTFRIAGTLAASAANSSSLTVTAPACNVNDILIACIMTKLLNNTISAPDATWNSIYQDNGDCTDASDDHRCAIFWKRATASGGDFAFTFANKSTDLKAGVILAFGGCPMRSTPIDATAVGATVTAGVNDAVAFPAFDPTNIRAEIVYVAFYGDDATAFNAAMSSDTNPDCTIRTDQETSLGTDCTIAVTSGPTTDGSAISARTWSSAASTTSGSTGVVFGLVPVGRKFITHV